MAVNFLPTLEGYVPQQEFRFWCQRVLPLVYDDSLSYYELLNKVVQYLNVVIENVGTMEENIDAIYLAYSQLQEWVNTYFDNLDVQEEINNKLDEMALDGSLSELLEPFIPNIITAWLEENVNPVGSAVMVDRSLEISGAAADAAVTGTNFKNSLMYSDLANNTDLDTLYGVTAFYTMTQAGVYPNAPESSGRRMLEIFHTKNSPYTIQRFTNYTTKNVYFRIYASSAWLDWRLASSYDVQSLDAGADVDNLRGINVVYTLSYAGSYSNIPSNENSGRRILEIFTPEGVDYTVQRFTNYTTKRMYQRVYASNDWLDWVTIGNIDVLGLDNGVDLNTLSNISCIYTIGLNSTHANAPEATGRRMLEVFSPPSTTYTVQRFTNYTTKNVYERIHASDTWEAWKLISPIIDVLTLADGSNLNNLFNTNKIYTMGYSQSFANIPDGQSVGRRMLEVFSPDSTTYTVQRFTNYTTQNYYQRIYASDAWLPWVRFSTDDRLPEICGNFNYRIATSHGGCFTNSKYENSPKAFKDARSKGILYQDLDVVFTSDLVPVICHASFADNAIRIADGDTSRINIFEHTLNDLKTNYLFGDSNYNWTIQTLAEAYAFNLELGCYICIDVGGGENNPTGAIDGLCDYMIEHGIKCEYLVTSEMYTFNILMNNGGENFNLGIVVASTASESVASANQKINAIISAKSTLNLKKAWCLTRRERMVENGDLYSRVSDLLDGDVLIGSYSYDASTALGDIPTWYSLCVSQYVNVNYARYINNV